MDAVLFAAGSVAGQLLMFTLLVQMLLLVLVVGGVGGVATLVWLFVPSARKRFYQWSTTSRERKRNRSLVRFDDSFEQQLADLGQRPVVIDLLSEPKF